MSKAPLKVAIIGMGGYAADHHRGMLELETRGAARLLATCEPEPVRFRAAQTDWRFAERGVRVFDDYRRLLESCAGELDVVVIATPIHLHADMHAAAVAAKVAVYLEKPPTLDPAEFEIMLQVEQAATYQTAVGFNYIVEPTRQALKRRLLAGEFGAPLEARLSAFWPRPAAYFERNGWSGRLALEGRLVLDSCFGNGMSHFVHNLLFWLGEEQDSFAAVRSVRADLLRAHAIEGADTFFVEARTDRELLLRIAMTHACSGEHRHQEVVVCEYATLSYGVGLSGSIAWRDGHTEPVVPPEFRHLTENHLAYFRYLRGLAPRPPTRLEDCRPFVEANAMTYLAAQGISDINPQQVIKRGEFLDVAGLEAMAQAFLARGDWPRGLGQKQQDSRSVERSELSKLKMLIAALTLTASA